MIVISNQESADLTLFSREIDLIKYLRFLPFNYYLCCIYSAAFLYKARSLGIVIAM
jgi:hypothetical protein